jgi:hypothetical protein
MVSKYFAVDVVNAEKVPSETVEGTEGLVVAERNGLRILRSLTWGVPRQTREMQAAGEPPGLIGLASNLTNPLWEQVALDTRYRCLIPVSYFAYTDWKSLCPRKIARPTY